MIVLDTSGLISLLDASERTHQAARAAMDAEPGPFILSPFVLAETDYLLASRVGVDSELTFLRAVAAGEYQLETFDDDEIARAADVVERYRTLELGLADASLVVLADRVGSLRLLTLDERHFRAVKPLRGRAFTLLPADA